jgi:hypothetical protein
MLRHYWTIWLAAVALTFAAREFPALATGRPQDTLSWYVWQHLKVIRHQPVSQWSATHFLVAGVALVFAVWALGHLFLRIWAGR